MEQHFLIDGYSIKVTFGEGAIHIVNNDELWKLLDNNTGSGTARLVTAVKQAYKRLYNKGLEIADDSLAVEIWGHVYFEYFAIVFEKLVNMSLVKQVTNKISSYCEVIDCGESGKDSNRFFWDMLAPLKGIIAKMLPEGIALKHGKNKEA